MRSFTATMALATLLGLAAPTPVRADSGGSGGKSGGKSSKKHPHHASADKRVPRQRTRAKPPKNVEHAPKERAEVKRAPPAEQKPPAQDDINSRFIFDEKHPSGQ